MLNSWLTRVTASLAAFSLCGGLVFLTGCDDDCGECEEEVVEVSCDECPPFSTTQYENAPVTLHEDNDWDTQYDGYDTDHTVNYGGDTDENDEDFVFFDGDDDGDVIVHERRVYRDDGAHEVRVRDHDDASFETRSDRDYDSDRREGDVNVNVHQDQSAPKAEAEAAPAPKSEAEVKTEEVKSEVKSDADLKAEADLNADKPVDANADANLNAEPAPIDTQAEIKTEESELKTEEVKSEGDKDTTKINADKVEINANEVHVNQK